MTRISKQHLPSSSGESTLTASRKKRRWSLAVMCIFLVCATIGLLERSNDNAMNSEPTQQEGEGEGGGGGSNSITSRTNNNNARTKRNWIWSRMTSEEQQGALQDTLPYLQAFIHVLQQTKRDRWVSHERCPITLFGSQWGTHQLCNMTPPPSDCNFISFGIHKDYSFDTDLAERWHCHGFAADPTIVHPSQLHRLVTFHNIAAKTLRPNQEQQKQQKRKQKADWWTASVPSVRKFLGLDQIAVLKLDCEGCEFSLARDVLEEDPHFFDSVDQFTFEVHLNTLWLNDTESLYYYAQLFKLLHESNLQVMGTSIGGCGWDNEGKYDAYPPLVELGYPGQGSPETTKPKQRRSCHEYLFARYNGTNCIGCRVPIPPGGKIPDVETLERIAAEAMKLKEKS